MWSPTMLQSVITWHKETVAVFFHLCCRGDRWKAESPTQLIKWLSCNKSIFCHCVDKKNICRVRDTLDPELHKANVPITFVQNKLFLRLHLGLIYHPNRQIQDTLKTHGVCYETAGRVKIDRQICQPTRKKTWVTYPEEIENLLT